jgi:HNH endonuclease
MPEIIEYDGRKFYRQPGRDYYTCGPRKGEEQLLHRYIWAKANGPIPAAHAIHHINHDPHDNRLENLECVPLRAHAKEHAAERVATEVGRANMRKAARALWEGREAQSYDCLYCGKPFLSRDVKPPKWCGTICSQRAGRRRRGEVAYV